MKNSWQFTWLPVLRLLVATGLIAAALGYRPSSRSIASEPQRHDQMKDPGPCPHYWSRFFRNHNVDTSLFLAGRQIDVPEYNDCQRLLVNTSSKPDPVYTQLKFGNVAVIWARQGIKEVYETEAPIGNAIGRPFYAALKNPNPTTTRVTAIALVWTTGTYKPLGMRAGFACIVLQWEGPVAARLPRNYHAWMVPLARQQPCVSPLDLPAATAFYLGAQELPAEMNGNVPDEIPPVARWDWDGHRGEQYVGIACPSGWCELYGENPHTPHGHHGSPNYHVPTGLNLVGHEGQVVRQKGWYDQEYLASTISKSGTQPELDDAGALGTVFPVPALGTRNTQDYHLGDFVPVAWISISPLSKGYAGKYGFSSNIAPPQRPDVNALFLCRDDGHKKCKVKLKHQCSPTRDQASGDLYYARLGASPDDPNGTDFCVDFIGTTLGVPTPGTVRWRWLDDDQTIWVSCPSGCCQIHPPPK